MLVNGSQRFCGPVPSGLLFAITAGRCFGQGSHLGTALRPEANG